MKFTRMMAIVLTCVLCALTFVSCGGNGDNGGKEQVSLVSIIIEIPGRDEPLLDEFLKLESNDISVLEAVKKVCFEHDIKYEEDSHGDIIKIGDYENTTDASGNTVSWRLKTLNGDEDASSSAIVKDKDEVVFSYLGYTKETTEADVQETEPEETEAPKETEEFDPSV